MAEVPWPTAASRVQAIVERKESFGEMGKNGERDFIVGIGQWSVGESMLL